jgi:hypothetical protein
MRERFIKSLHKKLPIILEELKPNIPKLSRAAHTPSGTYAACGYDITVLN